MHVPFEGLRHFENILKKNAYNLNYLKLYEPHHFPETDSFELLIIMGGPMGIYDDQDYPWLKEERDFIEKAIVNGKKVIGICLGAQFIADALGAKVYPNKQAEIGWFPIHKRTPHPLSKELPESFPVFHWHGDTFNIPEQAVHLFESKGCSNQAFIYDDRILALQFHLEINAEGLQEMLQFVGDNIVEGKYVQSAAEIKEKQAYIEDCNRYLALLFEAFIQLPL